MVVVAIVATLMGVLGVSVAEAQKQARIGKAKQEINEITNAIRAYETYVDDGLQDMSDVQATKSSLGFLLGNGTDRSGNQIPVLYNANTVGENINDPWGQPYRIRIKAASAEEASDQVAKSMTTGVFVPNRYHRRAEVQK